MPIFIEKAPDVQLFLHTIWEYVKKILPCDHSSTASYRAYRNIGNG